MGRENRYRFVSSPFFLGLFLLFMLVTSLVLSDTLFSFSGNRWIPLLSGIVDTSGFSATLSVLLSLATLSVTSFSIYYLNERLFSCGKSSSAITIFYLILVFSNPESVFFNGSSIAAPLLLWSIYYTMFTKDGEKQLFTALFLISCATLFDYHLIFVIPLIFYYSLVTSSFAVRSIFVALTSLVIPYILVLSFRYLFFGDVSEFLALMVDDITDINSPYLKMESVAGVMLVLSVILIIYRAVVSELGVINRYKVVKSIGLVRQIAVMVVLFAIIILYKEVQSTYIVLVAIPLSFIIMEYLSLKTTGSYRRVEFLVMLILLALNRIAEFL